MREELMLLNPDKSEIMVRAHELRADEDMSMSEALELAWSEVGEGNPRVRKAVKKVAEDVGTSGLLLLAVAGLVAHRLIAKQWIWETIQIGRMKQRAVAEAERIAQPKGNPHEHHSVSPAPYDRTQEIVHLIMP